MLQPPAEEALLSLGRALRKEGYRFTTVTPETHRRVNARGVEARTLTDVFGWSRTFEPGVLSDELLDLLRVAGALETRGPRFASQLRFSTLGEQLFVHSAYPTLAEYAVFFGPDTYRFASLLKREIGAARRVIDVGAGSGAGGLVLADRVEHVVLADINEKSLSYSRVNAALNGCKAEIVSSDILDGIRGEYDLVISNPPYLADPQGRAYRDGGAELGTSLGARIVEQAMARLAPGGRLLLYTGAPVVAGEDLFRRAITGLLGGSKWRYEELDPDVFGEELDSPAYAAVDRIAVVALSATKS